VTAGPVVRFGEGRAAELGDVLGGAASVFLVTGTDSFERSGARELLGPSLAGRRCVRFAGVRPNPELGQVAEAVSRLRAEPCDAALGVGGGSVLDVAKLAAVLAAQPGDPSEYVARGRELERGRRCRLVLVPTTAGTGSEATRFATVWVDGRKRSLDHPALHADAALVDPLLTRGQPAAVAASAGLDALSQAIESLWSPRATLESARIAGEAIDLLLPNLGVQRPDRSSLAYAALLAGQAIDVTRTTAAHAFAYPLTGRFGVAHGHACALNLGWLLPFNGAAGGPRMRSLLDRLGVGNGEEAGHAILALVERLGLVRRLSELGVRDEDLEALVDEGLASDRAANNPRPLDAEAALAGLRSVL
jgi:alcohol dehydrogenase